MAEKAVILLSGGIDSATAAYWAKKEKGMELHALSIDYGQKAIREVECATEIALRLDIQSFRRIDVSDLKEAFKSPLNQMDIDQAENDRDGDSFYVVPLRNMVFLSIASAYAQSIGAKHVVIGNHLDDAKGFPDCRPGAMKAMQNVVNVASEKGKAVTLHSPWLESSKADIIGHGLELRVPYEHTYSCYEKDNDTRHCGKCESCEYRYQAFVDVGTIDPAPYAYIPEGVQ